MAIKTIRLPESLHSAAEALHRWLIAPPALRWELRVERDDQVRSRQLAVSLRIDSPLPGITHTLTQLQIDHAAQKIIEGRQPLRCGTAEITCPDLSGCSIGSEDLLLGSIRLPPFVVALPGLPDPVIEGLTAVPDQQAFLLHLRGSLTGTRFDARLVW